MKIDMSSMVMAARHTAQQKWSFNESVRASISTRRQAVPASTTQAATAQAAAPITSDAALTAPKASPPQSAEATAIQKGVDAANQDPILQVIRAMIAILTGEDVKVFDASALSSEAPLTTAAPTEATEQSTAANSGNSQAAPQSTAANNTGNTGNSQTAQQSAVAGSLEYTRTESYTETEQTRFAASGVVRTTDGKEINFSFAIDMTRRYHEETSTSVRVGNTRKTQDPLVINFGGTATQLTSQRFKFDLNADGKSENINFATQGSGFLAFDRNGDGKINDGSELFGTQSGNGFADLALLDADHNGWIDENDPAYLQLRVWSKDASGNDQLSTLKQTDVGALSVAQVATPFSIKNERNELQGQIQGSGVFLSESGKVGTLQQVDLTI